MVSTKPSCCRSLLAMLLCCALPARALLQNSHKQEGDFNWMTEPSHSAAGDAKSAWEILPKTKKSLQLKYPYGPAAGEWESLQAKEKQLNQKVFVETEEEQVFPPNLVTSIQWDDYEKPHGECPSMFVVVMSRRENIGGRLVIRDMWKEADVGWGELQAKFGMCTRPADDAVENASLQARLMDEEKKFGDIVFLDCREGYKHGQLTRKLLASMKLYLTSYSSYELFMKTDDDAFVSTRRLCDFLSTQPSNGNDFKHSYAGVFAEIGEYLNARKVPCRDATSDWFEPFSKFNSTTYPVSAKGGPGYILSRNLVSVVIRNGIAYKNILNNEDKAVGVWVEAVKRRGQQVDYVNLPGTDGYDQWHPMIRKTGAWAWYPYVVHHHLESSEIACLHRLDKDKDKTRLIDSCFQSEASHSQPMNLRSRRSQEGRPHNLAGRRGESHLSEQLLACLGA